MARGYLKDIEYRTTDISDYILKLIRRNHTKQKEVARMLNITEGRMSQKLKDGAFTTVELLKIFKALDADREEVAKLFTF